MYLVIVEYINQATCIATLITDLWNSLAAILNLAKLMIIIIMLSYIEDSMRNLPCRRYTLMQLSCMLV